MHTIDILNTVFQKREFNESHNKKKAAQRMSSIIKQAKYQRNFRRVRAEDKSNKQWGIQTDSSGTDDEEEIKRRESSSCDDQDGGGYENIQSEGITNRDDGTPLRDKEFYSAQLTSELGDINSKIGLDYLPVSRKMSAEYEKEKAIYGILKVSSQSQ